MKLTSILAAAGLATVTAACDQTAKAPVQRDACISDDGSRKSIIIDDSGDLKLTLSDKSDPEVFKERHVNALGNTHLKGLMAEAKTWCDTGKKPNDDLKSVTTVHDYILSESSFSCTGTNGKTATAGQSIFSRTLDTSDGSSRDDFDLYKQARTAALKFCGVVPAKP